MNTEITSSIHYVGVNDRHKDIFEGLWPLPYGVSYNSYIIDDEKVALIDTVEVDFFPQFLANIRSVIGDRKIDYIIVNHVEPDHSGALPLIKKYYPEARIVGNKKTFDMVRGYYNVGTGDDILEVSNGDTLELGKHTLSFTMIPMVHWPETMVTLDQTANVLFSGDAFGCFGALAGAFVDTDMNCDIYWDEMRRYYSNIVGKYGVPVQQALKKLAGVKIDYICSTHGPVWHEHIARVIEAYDRMSRYDTDRGVVICYGSMYGNTERAAEVIARAAAQASIRIRTVLKELPDCIYYIILFFICARKYFFPPRVGRRAGSCGRSGCRPSLPGSCNCPFPAGVRRICRGCAVSIIPDTGRCRRRR